MKSNIATISKAVVLGLLISVGVGYISAYSPWIDATVPPTGNNTDSPLHIGGPVGVNQSKVGGIWASFLGSTGNAIINGTIQILGGSPGIGKVLTSDANGIATWATPASGGSGSLLSGTPTPGYSPNTWTTVTTIASSSDNVKACFLTQIKHYNTDSGNNFNCEIRPPSLSGTAGLWQLVSESGTNENTMCKSLCIK